MTAPPRSQLPPRLAALVWTVLIVSQLAVRPCAAQQSSLLHKAPPAGGSSSRWVTAQIPPAGNYEPGNGPPQRASGEPTMPGVGYAGGPAAADHSFNSLANTSWTYAPPPPSRTLQKHDIISIRVEETSRLVASGVSNTRRQGLYDAALRDWIRLEGLKAVKPSDQSDGAPRLNSQMNENFRSDAQLQTRENLVFDIAATIADIRPNGDLVLEAHKTLSLNENVWEFSLSGVCRPQDIKSNNMVLSRDISDLRVERRDRGQVYDGYRRGWLNRLFTNLKPF